MVKPQSRPAKNRSVQLRFAFVEDLIENTEVLPKLKKPKRKALLTAKDRDLKIKREAVKKETQIQVCRSTKQALFETTVLRRSTALESKFRRFEIRCQFETVQLVNISWFSVLGALGAATVLIKKGYNYKVTDSQKLRARANKNLKWLLCVSRFLGKLLLSKHRRKMQRQSAKLKRLLRPVKAWLAIRRQVLSNYMVNTIEYALTNNLVFKLMVRWRYSIILIQTHIRSFLSFRRALYTTHMKRLREVEMTSVKGTKKKADGHSSIPDEVKMYFIRKKIKEDTYSYILALNYWKRICETVEQHNQANRVQLSTGTTLQSSSFSLLPLPPRPVMDLSFTKEIYRHILVSASSSRFHWDKIIGQANAHIELQMRKRRR